jgi:hypothetical protein
MYYFPALFGYIEVPEKSLFVGCKNETTTENVIILYFPDCADRVES